MSPMTNEEIEQRVLKMLESGQMKCRTVAKSIEGAEKKVVDEVIAKLAKEDKIEYIYLDTSYVRLKGKWQ